MEKFGKVSESDADEMKDLPRTCLVHGSWPAYELWVWFDVSGPQAETKEKWEYCLQEYWTWELSVIQSGSRVFSSLLFGSQQREAKGQELPGSWRAGVYTLGIAWRIHSCCPSSTITSRTRMWPLGNFLSVDIDCVKAGEKRIWDQCL